MVYDNLVCPTEAQDRLILALDVATRKEADVLIEAVEEQISFFKMGWQFLLADSGFQLIHDLIAADKRVFLDLKMDDIGNTVEQAVSQIAKWGVSFLTIHGNGATAAAAQVGRDKEPQPLLLSVTLLSHLDTGDLQDLGVIGPNTAYKTANEYVPVRAKKAIDAGCDGLIVSGPSIADVHKNHPSVPIVSPGIRLLNTSADDHKRLSTPYSAIADGATYLVVGRPIREAENPAEMTARFIEEIKGGMRASSHHPRSVSPSQLSAAQL